jgi:hypothetical protein
VNSATKFLDGILKIEIKTIPVSIIKKKQDARHYHGELHDKPPLENGFEVYVPWKNVNWQISKSQA